MASKAEMQPVSYFLTGLNMIGKSSIFSIKFLLYKDTKDLIITMVKINYYKMQCQVVDTGLVCFFHTGTGAETAVCVPQGTAPGLGSR